MPDTRYRPTPIAIAIAVLTTASILVVNFLTQHMHLQVWIPRLAVGTGAVIVLLLFNVGFAGLIRALARPQRCTSSGRGLPR